LLEEIKILVECNKKSCQIALIKVLTLNFS
jgi:hypothetical protein